MPSIAQAQSLFLSQGGPEGGTSKSTSYQVSVKGQNKAISFQGGFEKLGTMEALLALYIGEFLTAAANNLQASDSTTTGALEESLSFNITPTGRGYLVDFTALDYYKFVDKGVRGAGKSTKNQTSPYRFKYITPSKSHVEAIKKWITANNLTAQVTDIKRWGAAGREFKGTNMPLQSAAWLVARNIKRKGLTATNFWTKAFDETFADFGQTMSAALGEAVTFDLKKMAEEIKNKGTRIPKI